MAMSSSPKKRKASSVPATPSSPQGDLAQIRKQLSRNSYISGYQLNNYYNYHSGYSSLPRSTMSEPLGNCTSEHLGNIVYNSDGTTILEPVSEEARRISNLDNTINNPELSEYYFRDSFEHSSSESGLTNTYVDAQRLHHPGSRQLLYSNKSHQQQQQQHHHHQPIQHSNRMLLSSAATGATNNNSGYISHLSSTSNNNNNNNFSLIRQQNIANTAKNARKFRLLHAFIPSFLFVVIAMTISTVFILESDSEMFARIRNLPEMISLRYQYYQPLKDYLAKTLGTK